MLTGVNDARAFGLGSLVSAASGDESFSDRIRDALTQPLPTVLKWMVYVLCIAAAAMALVLIRRLWRRLPPRQGTTVALEDLTAEAGQRNSASHVLSRQLLTEINALNARGGRGEAEIDESADLDRTFLANLKLGVAGGGVEKLDALSQGEPAVSVGPVSFSLRQMAYLVASFFRRRSEFELAGSLTAQGGRQVLVAERLGAAGQVINRWYAARDGPSATADVVGDIAMQAVVDLGSSTATSDWRSFRDYRRALEELEREVEEGGDERAKLENAQRLLRRSLECDPLNPLARFYLATVVRKLGDNGGAVRQFELLEQFIVTSAAAQEGGFFKSHPEFRPIVRYNLAVSLLKLARPDHRRALRILNGLLEQSERPGVSSRFEGLARYRYRVLVQSALAAALTLRLEKQFHRRDDSDADSEGSRRAYLDRLFAEIEELRKAVSPLTREALQAPVAYSSALATTENAYGQACVLLGQQAEGIAAFRRAIAVRPDFVDAHLNLAEALLNSAEFQWQGQAEGTLQEVLRIDPGNGRAEYLYARLLLDPAVARPAEARAHLERAGAHPQALFMRAEILAEQDHDLTGAIALLDQAIALAPGANQRMFLYVKYVLKLAESGAADRQLLQRAQDRARRLARDGVTPRFRRRGADLLTQVEALIATEAPV